MDVMTLKRKISDLETILSENRDRELAALGGRGTSAGRGASASAASGSASRLSGNSGHKHLVGPGGDGIRPEEVRFQKECDKVLLGYNSGENKSELLYLSDL